MDEEILIPLNDELLTVAKIMDIESISSNYNLTYIARVLSVTDLNSLLHGRTGSFCFDDVVNTLTFFIDTELVTPEFKEEGTRALGILNGYKAGLVLTDTDVSTLKTTLSLVYGELVVYGKNNIGLHKPVIFSLVDGELEKVLEKINTYPYATIAKLNSLIFKNVNSLVHIGKVMDIEIRNVNTKLAQLDVMIDMGKVTNSYTRGQLVSYVKDLCRNSRCLINNIFDHKYLNPDGDRRYEYSFSEHDDITVDATNEEILNKINGVREAIKSIYGTLRVGLLETAFNLPIDSIEVNNPDNTLVAEAEFKESLFRLKSNINLMTEIVCSTTDAINGSIEKLKLSTPKKDEEIDNLDAI